MADVDLSDAGTGLPIFRPQIFTTLAVALALAGCNAGPGVAPSAWEGSIRRALTQKGNPQR